MTMGDNSLRVLFFGLPAGASADVLRGLLADGTCVAGVVLPADAVPHLLPEPDAPVAALPPPRPAGLSLLDAAADTMALAWSSGLPVLAVRDLAHHDTLAALAELAPDVGVVACFTLRIPAVMIALPRFGILNIHPSLLPAYRGPTPVFWQLRDGVPTGVTIHYLSEALDAGDIAAQGVHPLPDGITEMEAERLLMTAALTLLGGVLAELADGIVRRRPQPSGGSYFGFPRGVDFALSTTWAARRAFNFMCGTAGRGHPFTVAVDGETVWLAAAERYDDWAELGRACVRDGRHIAVQFNPGILYALIVGKP